MNVSYSWDGKQKLTKVTTKQAQKISDNVLKFEVPIRLRFKNGENVEDRVVELKEIQENFYFALPWKPEIIRIDPEYGLLAKLEITKPRDMRFAQFEDESDMIGRIWAIEALQKKSDRGLLL